MIDRKASLDKVSQEKKRVNEMIDFARKAGGLSSKDIGLSYEFALSILSARICLDAAYEEHNCSFGNELIEEQNSNYANVDSMKRGIVSGVRNLSSYLESQSNHQKDMVFRIESRYQQVKNHINVSNFRLEKSININENFLKNAQAHYRKGIEILKEAEIYRSLYPKKEVMVRFIEDALKDEVGKLEELLCAHSVKNLEK